MGESFPLFQSVLSSTPFSGTLADTSTPTPAGPQAQGPLLQGQPPQEPQDMPQVPQSNEFPGDAGNRQRAQKAADDIDQNIAMLDQQAHFLANAHYYTGNKWQKRLKEGLHGNSDIEPPNLMYKRLDMLNELEKTRTALLLHKQQILEPSPYEKAWAEAQGKSAVEQADRIQAQRTRGELFDQVDAAHFAQTGQHLDPVAKAMFVQNPTANLMAGSEGQENIGKFISGAQNIGEHATPEGITHLPPNMQGPAYDAYQAKQKDMAARGEGQPKGQYAGFDSLSQLHSAVESTFDDIKTQQGMGVPRVTSAPNPIPGLPDVQRIDYVLSPENAKKARAQALAAFPGAAKFLPGYVTTPGADALEAGGQGAAPSSAQKDLDPAEKTLEMLRNRKKKAE